MSGLTPPPPDRAGPPGRTDAPDGAGTPEEQNGWARLLRMGRPRATKANLLAAVLALALGFAIATQVHQTQTQSLSGLREDELVRVLDDVQQDNTRLGDEIQSLQAARDKLLSGVAGSSEARAAAQQRLDSLGILAGTVPATGPGITITILDPKDGVTAALMLDTLEELRDAGAEAVQVDDVRVVASSYFSDTSDGGLTLSGEAISSPYRLRAIGDAATLAAAMDIPGGVTESVRHVGATISISQDKTVTIDALHSIQQPRYARPVSEPSPSTS